MFSIISFMILTIYNSIYTLDTKGLQNGIYLIPKEFKLWKSLAVLPVLMLAFTF